MAVKGPETSLLNLSAAQATVAAAALALVSGAIGGAIQAWSTRDTEKLKQEATERLDREKFETDLIFKAIDTPDRDKQITNLKFFVQIGFIRDPEDKIKNMPLSDLPSPTANQSPPNTDYSGLQPQLISLLKNFDPTAPDANTLRGIEGQILKLAQVQLNDNQLSALTSFVYNVGIGAFVKSLLPLINAGHFDAAADAMLQFNKAAGRELDGLKRRRQMEVQLFKLPPGA